MREYLKQGEQQVNNLKFNRAALSLTTLFLFGVLSGAVFCQQPSADFRGAAIQESARADSEKFSFKVEKNLLIEKRATEKNKAGFAVRQTTAYTRPNAEKRFKKYINRTFGAYAFLGYAVQSGFSQITDSPEEWENNAKGYARRFGSAVGRNAIKETAVYGLDEALKLDSNFYRSGKKKFGDRIANAFLSTFTARRANGKRVVGAPRLIGTYAASIIAAETWYPKRFDYKDGLRLGTISLGVNLGVNVLKEFFLKK